MKWSNASIKIIITPFLQRPLITRASMWNMFSVFFHNNNNIQILSVSALHQVCVQHWANKNYV